MTHTETVVFKDPLPGFRLPCCLLNGAVVSTVTEAVTKVDISRGVSDAQINPLIRILYAVPARNPSPCKGRL